MTLLDFGTVKATLLDLYLQLILGPLANALLAPTTRVEDVFFGIYHWLDRHPSEAVLVSINREGNTGTPDDAAFYEKLYNILNSPLAKKYWIQTNGTVRFRMFITFEKKILIIFYSPSVGHLGRGARKINPPSALQLVSPSQWSRQAVWRLPRRGAMDG